MNKHSLHTFTVHVKLANLLIRFDFSVYFMNFVGEKIGDKHRLNRIKPQNLPDQKAC